MPGNEQNTYTGGASPLVAPSGNGFLDSFLKLVNVGVEGAGKIYGLYGSVQERQIALEIARQNATQAPQQNLPASQIKSVTDYLSDPENVQKTFFYVGAAILLSIGTIYAFKKVF